MNEFNREEWESGPPEDKSERLQGIRHLNEKEYEDFLKGLSEYLCEKCPHKEGKNSGLGCPKDLGGCEK